MLRFNISIFQLLNMINFHDHLSNIVLNTQKDILKHRCIVSNNKNYITRQMDKFTPNHNKSSNMNINFLLKKWYYLYTLLILYHCEISNYPTLNKIHNEINSYSMTIYISYSILGVVRSIWFSIRFPKVDDIYQSGLGFIKI